MSKIPSIDVTLTKENVDSVVSAVVAVVKPQWNLADVKTEFINAGVLNIVVLCRPQTSQDQQDAIIIKTACEYYCGPIEENKVVWRFLDEQNMGPGTLAMINNGMCMALARGEMLHWNDKRLYDEKVWKKIAEEMARWHRRDVLKAAIKFGVRRPHILLGETAVARYAGCLTLPDIICHIHRFPTQQQLLEEVTCLSEQLLARGDLEEALCHLDPNATNITIYDEKTTNDSAFTHGIQMIDFDFTGICYSQVDIAWFFLTFMEIQNPGFDLLPDKIYQMNFLRHYLHHRRELDSGPDVTEAAVEKFYQQVDKAKLFIYLRFSMSGPSIAGYSGSNHFIEFSAKSWAIYQKLRKDVFVDLG